MLDSKVNSIRNGIDKELWLRARSAAVAEGKTITNWIAEAIEEKLGSGKPQGRLALPSNNHV